MSKQTKQVKSVKSAKTIQVESEIATLLSQARRERWMGIADGGETDYLLGFYQSCYPVEFSRVMRETSN